MPPSAAAAGDSRSKLPLAGIYTQGANLQTCFQSFLQRRKVENHLSVVTCSPALSHPGAGVQELGTETHEGPSWSAQCGGWQGD